MGKGIHNFMKERQISGLGLLLWLLVAAAVALGCFALVVLGVETPFPVYITEVLASNTVLPNAQGYCCDYIELHNRGDSPVDLTGYQLGDIAGSSRYAFPAGTVLEPGEYLVVYCSRTVAESGYAAFEIARSGGEDYYLIAANNAVVDQVTTVAMEPDQAMMRQRDGQWQLTMQPTPGSGAENPQPNQDIYNSGLSAVRITEFSAGGNGYHSGLGLFCDWIELQNTGTQPVDLSGFILSDNPGNDKYRFPTGTVLEPGEYWVVYCMEQATEPELAPFGLSQTRTETLVFKDPEGRMIELVTVPPAEQGSAALAAGIWTSTELSSPGFANTPEGHMAYLEQLGAAPGAIRISEVMSARQLVLPDQNGEFHDWVELYNPGQTAVNLVGWGLTDDPQQPGKWIFPEVTLEPGGYLVLFCSGQDRTEGDMLHCGFSLAAAGESLLLTSPLGTAVDAVTFGQAQTNQSFRFVAGEAQLWDTPTPGYANDDRGYAQFWEAGQPAGPLAIWEVMTSNNRYLPQQLGECYDWVELRNVSRQPVQLSEFTLTDDPDAPAAYHLPEKLLQPGEMVVIILSGDESLSTSRYAHAGFALDAAEDQLMLYSADGSLLDYVYLREIPREQSYGRGDTGGFGYMNPTPLKENATGFRAISAAPTASYPAGVYTGDRFTVALEAAGNIRYTTDGSVPDAASAEYTGPITITENTVLRAVALEADKLPSSVYTATFVTEAQHTLPVVSLVTDPDGLWGPDGVYKNGDISVKEVRLESHLSYSGEDGSFALECEMSLHGATTVLAFSKKSFTLRFRDDYDGPLQYDVFEDGAVTRFSSLLLRTSHESVYSSQMHDVVMADVANRSGERVAYQKYKYVAMYLNGEYWGLYAIREHHSPEHYGSYWEVPAEDVTMVRYMNDAVNSLSAFYSFCGSHSLASEENYAYAKSVLDLESFADWLIFQAYVCNVDIYENMRYYYSPADGIWRCGLSDMDLGMCGSHAAFDEVADTFHHGRVVKALLENEEFQQLLANRLAELLAGPLSDAAMCESIDRIAAQIRPEAAREEARWGTPVWGWENAVAYMKEFCDGRGKEMINSLCNLLGTSQAQREAWFGELE